MYSSAAVSESISPDQRLDELTALLATGLRRLLTLRADAPKTFSGDSEGVNNLVALSPDKSVTPAWLTAPREPERKPCR